MLKRIQPIEGFEDYAVTEDGRIWSFRKNRWLKPTKFVKTNYLYVTLCLHGIEKKKTIHRLVAETFIPNPDNKLQVNHINSIRQDNNISNLEWVTAGENQLHAYKNGFATIRTKQAIEKSSKKVECIETGRIFKSASEASRFMGYKSNNVTASIHQKTKAGGFTWRYID